MLIGLSDVLASVRLLFFILQSQSVCSAGVLAEDNMTTLLTADTAAVLSHILIDVLVTHCGLGVADALLIKSLIQAKVGHDRGNDGVGQKFATLLHIAAVDVQDVVTRNDISSTLHSKVEMFSNRGWMMVMDTFVMLYRYP